MWTSISERQFQKNPQQTMIYLWNEWDPWTPAGDSETSTMTVED